MSDLKTMLPLTAAMLVLASGVSAAERSKNSQRNTPMVQDWSSRAVGFADPDTPEEARARGAQHYKRWQRLASDPRFMLSLVDKLDSQADAMEIFRHTAKAGGGGPTPAPTPTQGANNNLHRDWSAVLGGASPSGSPGGDGNAGMYPAKYSFNINAAPDCSGDFVVFPTGNQGSDPAGANSTRAFSAYGDSNFAGSVTIGTIARQVTLSGDAASANAGLTFLTTNVGTTNAANLAAAVNRWSGTTGVSASVAGATVTLHANSPGSTITASETFGPELNIPSQIPDVGTAGQASIMAYNQLYTGAAPGCNATRTNPNPTTHPDVSWAYNSGGTVKTSPVLSYLDNGKQVAFVQNVGGQAELVLLKWKAGEGSPGYPATPALAATNADYRNGTGNCAGGVSCMRRIAFSNFTTVTYSSPFVDYSGDTLYVGSDIGSLYKFTGVFNGTPAESASGFPVVVSAGNPLSPAIYNFAGQVFVGSASGGGASGGMLHRVDATTGAVTDSAKLAIASSTGIRASPILDIRAGHVFAFVFDDGGGIGSNCSVAPCRAIVDFAFNFLAGSGGNKVRIGSGTDAARVQWHGTFDSVWRSSSNSTGSMYVCGGAAGNSAQSVLWKVPVAGGVLGTPLPGAAVSGTGNAECSPLSRVKNGANEYLHFSLTGDGSDGLADVCTGACVYSYDLASLGTPEQWTFIIAGSGVNNSAGSITVNGKTYTASTVQNCAAGTFNANGNSGADAIALRLCINSNPPPGIVETGALTLFRFVGATNGDLPDATVVSTMTNMPELNIAHLQGTSDAWQADNQPEAGLTAPGGTGGIVIDNISGTPGASQVYYLNLTSPSNGIQASQGKLQ